MLYEIIITGGYRVEVFEHANEEEYRLKSVRIIDRDEAEQEAEKRYGARLYELSLADFAGIVGRDHAGYWIRDSKERALELLYDMIGSPGFSEVRKKAVRAKIQELKQTTGA